VEAGEGSVVTEATIDLDWGAFDAARGTTGRVAASKLAVTPGANELIPLSPAAQKQVAAIQKKAGLPVTGQLDASTIAYAKSHYNVNAAGGGGKGKGKGKKKAGAKKKKRASTSASSRATTAKVKKLAQAKQKAAMQRAIMRAQQRALEGARKNSVAQGAAQHKEMMTGKKSTAAGVKAPAMATSTARIRQQSAMPTGARKTAKPVKVKKVGKRVSLANTQLVDLAAGHHVKGTPIRFHHNWVPVTPEESALYEKMGMGLTPPKISLPDSKSVADFAKRRDRSIAAQRKAQEKATNWYSKNNPYWESMDDDQVWKDFFAPIDKQAKSFWAAYQEPTQYALQNKILRGMEDDAGPRKMLMKTVNKMFTAGGMKAPTDLSLYRAIRATDPKAQDFIDSLTPGATYKERGMVSTTAMLNDAQGWLKSNPTDGYQPDRRISPMDTVLEIQVPKGTQILGGSTQFIETMLHPDTKYKVISVERRHADPTNPTSGDDPEPEFEYNHVTVEAQL
jgi:hypothetical protein